MDMLINLVLNKTSGKKKRKNKKERKEERKNTMTMATNTKKLMPFTRQYLLIPLSLFRETKQCVESIDSVRLQTSVLHYFHTFCFRALDDILHDTCLLRTVPW